MHAGESGSWLNPITNGVSKQLPVNDKPILYYPISMLMLSRISNLLAISTSHDLLGFRIACLKGIS